MRPPPWRAVLVLAAALTVAAASPGVDQARADTKAWDDTLASLLQVAGAYPSGYSGGPDPFVSTTYSHAQPYGYAGPTTLHAQYYNTPLPPSQVPHMFHMGPGVPPMLPYINAHPMYPAMYPYAMMQPPVSMYPYAMQAPYMPAPMSYNPYPGGYAHPAMYMPPFGGMPQPPPPSTASAGGGGGGDATGGGGGGTKSTSSTKLFRFASARADATAGAAAGVSRQRVSQKYPRPELPGPIVASDGREAPFLAVQPSALYVDPRAQNRMRNGVPPGMQGPPAGYMPPGLQEQEQQLQQQQAGVDQRQLFAQQHADMQQGFVPAGAPFPPQGALAMQQRMVPGMQPYTPRRPAMRGAVVRGIPHVADATLPVRVFQPNNMVPSPEEEQVLQAPSLRGSGSGSASGSSTAPKGGDKPKSTASKKP